MTDKARLRQLERMEKTAMQGVISAQEILDATKAVLAEVRAEIELERTRQ